MQIKFCGYTNPYTTNCYVDNLPTNKQSENRDLNSSHHDGAPGNICCTNSKMGKVLFNIHGSQRWTLKLDFAFFSVGLQPSINSTMGVYAAFKFDKSCPDSPDI